MEREAREEASNAGAVEELTDLLQNLSSPVVLTGEHNESLNASNSPVSSPLSPTKKGSENKTKLENYVISAFGSSPGFKKIQKEENAGDLIIVWENIRFMFKFTAIEVTVKNSDMKAVITKDFQSHKECDVFIFISSYSGFPAPQKPYFDITTEYGRPVIWIGKFLEKTSYNKNVAIAYLQRIGQDAKRLVSLHLEALKPERDNSERLQKVIKDDECLKREITLIIEKNMSD
ncbi:hypothetical protein GHT06_015649 [Daphnia sinensis]|uniref:Uncharacterized protein n=1 Tax=Daphnia sinensis TaxID=1820382 RepID=A0AAD5LBI3_9CRUS|nr:hypothetical protein GHT06_015649 [Daphnia sinensis]